MCRTLYGEGGGGLKGIRSFWRGNGIAVFKMTPEMALRQGIFETFRELRGDFDEIVNIQLSTNTQRMKKFLLLRFK